MDAFSAASGLEGFIGACLVDSGTGLMLASRGGGPINLEAAAALNSQVVRAEQQVIETLGTQDRIEDILITVGKQIHLIRPFEKAPDVFCTWSWRRRPEPLAWRAARPSPSRPPS